MRIFEKIKQRIFTLPQPEERSFLPDFVKALIMPQEIDKFHDDSSPLAPRRLLPNAIKSAFRHIFRFLIRLAESNIRTHLDLENPSQKHFLSCHILSFFFFLGVGFIFYFDGFLLSQTVFGVLSLAHQTFLPGLEIGVRSSLDSSCLYLISTFLEEPPVTCEHEPEATLYYHSLILSVLLSVVFSVHYYLKYGQSHIRAKDANFHFYGHTVPIIVHFVVGWLVVLAFAVGSYLIIVYGPDYLHLNGIPGFFLIQVFLNAFAQQLVTGSLTSQWKLALPYSLYTTRQGD